MSIILFIVLAIALQFLFNDFGLAILISLAAAIWLCCIRIFFKVDQIRCQLKNYESKYNDVMRRIANASDEEKTNNISNDANDVEDK